VTLLELFGRYESKVFEITTSMISNGKVKRPNELNDFVVLSLSDRRQTKRN